VVKVPDHLGDEAAATLPCAALTAWNAVMTEGGIKPGDKVLIQGTGGVSLFALQFAKLAGAHVIVLSQSEEKMERALALGADQALNYKTVPGMGQGSPGISRRRWRRSCSRGRRRKDAGAISPGGSQRRHD
jgi:NADPH:quinone reductase-like Zn-dependent oxidoreductase